MPADVKIPDLMWVRRLSRPRAVPTRAAPALGEHNQFVLVNILGSSAERIVKLREARVFG